MINLNSVTKVKKGKNILRVARMYNYRPSLLRDGCIDGDPRLDGIERLRRVRHGNR